MKPKIVTYLSGMRCWVLNGRLHREDGPAAIYSDGSKAWGFDGRYYNQKLWFNIILKRNLR